MEYPKRRFSTDEEFGGDPKKIKLEQIPVFVELHESNEDFQIIPIDIMTHEMDLLLKHEKDKHQTRDPIAGHDAAFETGHLVNRDANAIDRRLR